MERNDPGSAPSRSRFFFISIITIAVFLSVFTLGIVVGQNFSLVPSLATDEQEASLKNQSSDEQVDFATFWKVWSLVNKKHIEAPFDEQQLMYGAIKGMVEAIGDPHSTFWDVEETKEFSNWINGAFSGIGIEIEEKDGTTVILNTLEQTPAQQADLKSGDIIIKVDGESTFGMSLQEVVVKIRGEKGTTVALTIIRGEEQLEKEIVRDTITTPSVHWEVNEDDNIAYLEILHFGDTTITSFEEAVAEILAKDPQGLILDLRDNGGGYLQAAIHISSMFFEDGIVMIEQSKGEKEEYEVEEKGVLAKIPVVVLVNGYSASASEIVAGGIQDRKRGVLVGETSFGKGTIQNLENLEDGSSIRLTFAHWFTPLGTNVSNEGLHPEIEVLLDEEKEGDEQFEKAKEILLGESPQL